jgi:anti-sigma factor RsiW
MANDDALTCQEVVELVTEYLEDALLPEMRRQLEEHIVDCPGCATSLEQVRQTVGLLRRFAREPAFPATRQELLQLFRNWKQGPSSWEGNIPS